MLICLPPFNCSICKECCNKLRVHTFFSLHLHSLDLWTYTRKNDRDWKIWKPIVELCIIEERTKLLKIYFFLNFQIYKKKKKKVLKDFCFYFLTIFYIKTEKLQNFQKNRRWFELDWKWFLILICKTVEIFKFTK